MDRTDLNGDKSTTTILDLSNEIINIILSNAREKNALLAHPRFNTINPMQDVHDWNTEIQSMYYFKGDINLATMIHDNFHLASLIDYKRQAIIHFWPSNLAQRCKLVLPDCVTHLTFIRAYDTKLAIVGINLVSLTIINIHKSASNNDVIIDVHSAPKLVSALYTWDDFCVDRRPLVAVLRGSNVRPVVASIQKSNDMTDADDTTDDMFDKFNKYIHTDHKDLPLQRSHCSRYSHRYRSYFIHSLKFRDHDIYQPELVSATVQVLHFHRWIDNLHVPETVSMLKFSLEGHIDIMDLSRMQIRHLVIKRLYDNNDNDGELFIGKLLLPDSLISLYVSCTFGELPSFSNCAALQYINCSYDIVDGSKDVYLNLDINESLQYASFVVTFEHPGDNDTNDTNDTNEVLIVRPKMYIKLTPTLASKITYLKLHTCYFSATDLTMSDDLKVDNLFPQLKIASFSNIAIEQRLFNTLRNIQNLSLTYCQALINDLNNSTSKQNNGIITINDFHNLIGLSCTQTSLSLGQRELAALKKVYISASNPEVFLGFLTNVQDLRIFTAANRLVLPMLHTLETLRISLGDANHTTLATYVDISKCRNLTRLVTNDVIDELVMFKPADGESMKKVLHVMKHHYL